MEKRPPAPTLLITDDNPVNRKALNFILREAYPNIIETGDGESCLHRLKNHDIDLLLLDLNMPNKSGFDVLEELNENPIPCRDSHRPAIIVVSADNQPSTISRALKLGASDYITTPFNRDELLARVKTHLALRMREQDLEDRVTERTHELEAANQRLKQTQNQLIQAEKMVSLGQLAAGVAHEINNPIGYINSNLGSLESYLEDYRKLASAYKHTEIITTSKEAQDIQNNIDFEHTNNEVEQIIHDSLTGVRRVRQIVADLKVFSHPEQQEWQQLNINECIHSVLNIVHSEVKYKADVQLNLAEPIIEIECITTRIYQVITNLLVNAAQAIETFGKINISTEHADKQLIIKIEDTGSGMSPDVLNKIFDPFYTTKPVGEGTGLGLSVSYGIIESHGGKILVESTEGEGTCFTLRLPVKQTIGLTTAPKS